MTINLIRFKMQDIFLLRNQDQKWKRIISVNDEL